MIELKNEVDIRDFVRGSTFMGTGGGGPQTTGLKFLMDDIQEGRKISWINASEIPDDAWTCVPYYMGSIAPMVPETEIKMKSMGLTEEKVERVLIKAVEELQNYMGIEFDAVVPVELGGINTPAPVDAAIRMGIPIVDGDYAGRAVPEVIQASPVLFGRKLSPIVSCDKWGNVVILKDTVNNTMLETFGKVVSTAAFVICGQCGIALRGREMKEAIIPGTLTRCYQIGKAIREARENGGNQIASAIEATNGFLLFKGKVIKKEWEDREGYLYGTSTIEGIDEFKGKQYRIWYKNENHISWLDGKPHVMSPDLIEVVELDTAEPITNTDLKEKDMVAVIGMSNEKYRSELGLSLMGPGHFGFDLDYVPIERIMEL
jgi:DUF917 family protein